MGDSSILGIIAALITGGGLTAIGKFILDMAGGRAQAAKDRHKDGLELAKIAQHAETAAEIRADCEAENRRRVQEWAWVLVRALIMRGVPREDIPPEPTLQTCTTTPPGPSE